MKFSCGTEGHRHFISIARNVPDMNSMAVFHDVWMANLNAQNTFFLAGTILPAVYVNYNA